MKEGIGSAPGTEANAGAVSHGRVAKPTSPPASPQTPEGSGEAVPYVHTYPPPCRVCGKIDTVACYRDEAPEKAICVECCETAEHEDGETGHVWTYDRAERDRVCDHCGQFARNTDYYDNQEQP